MACIDSGLFDAIQPNFNVFAGQEMFDLIAEAKKQDVGVICKKVLAGGDRFWQRRPGRKRDIELRLKKSDYTIGQALLKWALDVPGVTAVVPLITNFKHLEEDIAVGFEEKVLSKEATAANKRTVLAMTAGLSTDYCRACSQCVNVCPNKVSIPEIFRYELYFSGYEKTKQARRLYQSLPKNQNADNCDLCGTCENVCPNNLPIREKLLEAHQLLAV
jgi:predicted aldo/keto reductase-like oxidoreductase